MLSIDFHPKSIFDWHVYSKIVGDHRRAASSSSDQHYHASHPDHLSDFSTSEASFVIFPFYGYESITSVDTILDKDNIFLRHQMLACWVAS